MLARSPADTRRLGRGSLAPRPGMAPVRGINTPLVAVECSYERRGRRAARIHHRMVSMESHMNRVLVLIGVLALSGLAPSVAFGQHGMPGGTPMTFFVTSEPIGDGGNLGGLAGANAHCQKLAQTVGAGDRTWRAYLSTQ